MTLRNDIEIELGGFYGHSNKRVSIGVLRRSAHKVLPRFPDLVEPAIHEAVIRLHTLSEPDAVDNPDAFGAWVAHNTAMDLRSRELRQRDIVSALTRKDVIAVSYGVEALAREDLLKRFLAALESTPMGVRCSFRRSVTRVSRQNGTTKTAILRETWRTFCTTWCPEVIQTGNLKMPAAFVG